MTRKSTARQGCWSCRSALGLEGSTDISSPYPNGDHRTLTRSVIPALRAGISIDSALPDVPW